jgi:cellulose synthase/poly-beta-1,6-N-acetylglucosamine synthase-like glycosyltransferase
VKGNDQAFASVVVPTRDRPELLRACLRSISESAYPAARLEVLVVDDGSAAGEVVRDVVSAAKGGIETVLLQSWVRGPAAARNAAARRARGEVLAFTDDDCCVHRDWLARLVAAVQETAGGAAGGRTRNGLPDNRWATTSQRIVDLVYAHFNADAADPQFLATNNLAVSAEAFRAAGGFDERYPLAGGEDRAFCRMWRSRGLRLRYEPRALVEHTHVLTLPTFLRQHFNYGRGAFRFHRDAAVEHDSQLRKSLAFHAAVPRLLGSVVPAGPGRARELAATVAGLVLWETANAAGVAREAFSPRRDPRGGRAGGRDAGQVVEDVEGETNRRSGKTLPSE